jgi:hypothetical protein
MSREFMGLLRGPVAAVASLHVPDVLKSKAGGAGQKRWSEGEKNKAATRYGCGLSFSAPCRTRTYNPLIKSRIPPLIVPFAYLLIEQGYLPQLSIR